MKSENHTEMPPEHSLISFPWITDWQMLYQALHFQQLFLRGILSCQVFRRGRVEFLVRCRWPSWRHSPSEPCFVQCHLLTFPHCPKIYPDTYHHKQSNMFQKSQHKSYKIIRKQQTTSALILWRQLLLLTAISLDLRKNAFNHSKIVSSTAKKFIPINDRSAVNEKFQRKSSLNLTLSLNS